MAIGRSENMRRIRSKNTQPELRVRAVLRELGFTGYRLHRRELPGKPDIVFIRRKRAIFVHGCFWHGHDCLEGRRIPKSNADYWVGKISRNKARDIEHIKSLQCAGWKVIAVWDCELKDDSALRDRLVQFFLEIGDKLSDPC